jgi:hypothetical protein
VVSSSARDVSAAEGVDDGPDVGMVDPVLLN